MPSSPAGTFNVQVNLVQVGYRLPVLWVKTSPKTLTCLRMVLHGHNRAHIDAFMSVALKVLKLHPANSCTRTCAFESMIVVGHTKACMSGLNRIQQLDLLPCFQGTHTR